MSIDSDIYTALQAYAPLTALVGDRVYPEEAAQDTPYPLVTITRIAGVPDVGLLGPTNMMACRYQFSVWGDVFDTAVTAANHLAAALNAATAFAKVYLAHYAGPVEPGLKLYHRIVEFSIWEET